MKSCTICNKELRGIQSKFCSNKCKQKGHYNRVKEAPNSYSNQSWRALRRKVDLINQRGGGCEKCGYNKNIAALEFHHKDSSTKESQLDMRRLANSSIDFVNSEFQKCLVLCSICHREHHSPHLDFDLVNEKLKNKPKKEIIINGPPLCIDCNKTINYTYIRCKSCNYKTRRKVNRPDIELLKKEMIEQGPSWCSKKYKVSRSSINKWIKLSN